MELELVERAGDAGRGGGDARVAEESVGVDGGVVAAPEAARRRARLAGVNGAQ